MVDRESIGIVLVLPRAQNRSLYIRVAGGPNMQTQAERRWLADVYRSAGTSAAVTVGYCAIALAAVFSLVVFAAPADVDGLIAAARAKALRVVAHARLTHSRDLYRQRLALWRSPPLPMRSSVSSH